MKTLTQKEMMLELQKRKKKKHEIETLIHEAETEVKLEILTPGKVKAKTLKGFYFQQDLTKTKAREITPRIIVKNMIKRFVNMVITTNGKNHNVTVAEQEGNEV